MTTYEQALKSWNGRTDSKSKYATARIAGASHKQAVIYAVTGIGEGKWFNG